MSDDKDLRTAHAAKSSQLKSTFDAAVKGILHRVHRRPHAARREHGRWRARAPAHQDHRERRQEPRRRIGERRRRHRELRTLGFTLETSKQRFGSELAIPAPEYMKFLERAQDCLGVFGLRVTVLAKEKPADDQKIKS